MNDDKIYIDIKSKRNIDEHGYAVDAFEDINFSINKNEIIVLLSSSNINPSELLKEICKNNTSGNCIYIPPQASSFPWLNVQENITFNLNSFDKGKVENIINTLGLLGYEDHYPHNNSIGFRLRVALARAVAHNPELLVINNPFSKLSKKRRMEFYSLLKTIKSQFGITMIVVLNPYSEANQLSDVVRILEGSPLNIINEK